MSGVASAETSAAHLEGMSGCCTAGWASARLLRQVDLLPAPSAALFTQQIGPASPEQAAGAKT